MKTMPRILKQDETAIADLIAVNLRRDGLQPIWIADSVSIGDQKRAAPTRRATHGQSMFQLGPTGFKPLHCVTALTLVQAI